MSFITTPAAAGGMTLLQTATANNSATVDLETGIGSSYDNYLIMFTGVWSTFNNDYLSCRFKIGGAYKTDANYAFSFMDQQGISYIGNYQPNVTRIDICQNIVNDIQGPASGRVFLFNVNSITQYKHIVADTSRWYGTTTERRFNSGGVYGDVGGLGKVTGIRFYTQVANMVEGTFKLYGLQNS